MNADGRVGRDVLYGDVNQHAPLIGNPYYYSGESAFLIQRRIRGDKAVGNNSLRIRCCAISRLKTREPCRGLKNPSRLKPVVEPVLWSLKAEVCRSCTDRTKSGQGTRQQMHAHYCEGQRRWGANRAMKSRRGCARSCFFGFSGLYLPTGGAWTVALATFACASEMNDVPERLKLDAGLWYSRGNVYLAVESSSLPPFLSCCVHREAELNNMDLTVSCGFGQRPFTAADMNCPDPGAQQRALYITGGHL